MSNLPGLPLVPEPADPDASAVLERAAPRVAIASEQQSETLSLLEETLHVSKRDVVTGTVRVSTRTEVFEQSADVTLDRTVAEVTRVPIGRLVEEPPVMRTEGDTTIVPVFEERYIVVKQLYLTEELHIRHEVRQVVSHIPVPLRRQTAIIERLDANGEVVVDQAPRT